MFHVLAPAIGRRLDEGRAQAVARVLHCNSRSLEHRLDIVAVHSNSRNAVTGRTLRNWNALPLVAPSHGRVVVVLAHEQHGQLSQRRKVHALVEHAGLDAGVSEKRDADVLLTAKLERERGAERQRH